MKSLRRSRRGFSLAELLIASAVAAAAASLLVGGLVSANRGADVRIKQSLSTHLLANQLALLDEELSDATPTSGTFPTPLAAFTWTLEIAPTDVPLSPLATATLTVAHNGHASHVVTCRPVAQ